MRLLGLGIITRFLMAEIIRLLLVTAMVIVVVTAFAGAIRFFASGLLGTLETLQVTVLLMVPMLQYALPFAGGFAATLAYHRMAQDREFLACHAGGVSHRRLLMPAMVVGVITSVLLFGLADQVMPRFLRSVQGLVTSDPTKLLASSVGKGQSLKLGDKLLYATDMIELPLDRQAIDAGVTRHLRLSGLVALDLDRSGSIEGEMASRLADVWIFQDEAGIADSQAAEREGGGRTSGGANSSMTKVVMRLRDPVGGRMGQALAEMDEGEIEFAIPSTLTDDPKYLQGEQLARAKADPTRLNFIDRRRRLVAFHLAQRRLIDAIDQELRSSGAAKFSDPSGRVIVLEGAGARPLRETDPYRGIASGSVHAIEPLTTGLETTGRVRVTVRQSGQSSGGGGSASSGLNPSTRRHIARYAYFTQSSATPNTAGSGGGVLTPSSPGDGPADLSGTTINIVLSDVTSSSEDDGGVTGGVLSELQLPALTPAVDPLPGLLKLPLDKLQALGDQAIAQPEAPGQSQALRRAVKELNRSVASVRREITSKQHERLASSISCLLMMLLGAVMGMRLAGSSPLVVYLWAFLPCTLGVIAISTGQSLTHRHGAIGLVVMYGGLGLLAAYTLAQYRILRRH